MMPWDHAVIGYIVFSLILHAFYRDSPSAHETIAVVFASALPDIIDKPLAWQFGILGGGRTLAHSVFFALPLTIAVLVFAASRGRLRLGLAFGIGYLLHLPGDVIPSSLRDGEFKIDMVLWPITEGGGGQGDSFYEEFMSNFIPYVQQVFQSVVSGETPSFLLLLFGLWGFTFLLWVYDGMPVLREVYLWVHRALSSNSSE